MEFREINDAEAAEFNDAMKIYLEAFPGNERHPVDIIGERVKQGANRLYVATLDDEIAFIG
jgi:hypothetical protein